MSAFAGVIPILATPFHDDESVAFKSWRRMLEFMAELGVDGVTILGVLGESNRLTDHEREALIRSAVEAIGGTVPIIVGTSHTGTAAARYLSLMAQDLGAHAVMVMPGKEAVYELYGRFAALLVFEQQPGVAVRKEVLRRRGLIASARARHPGATIGDPPRVSSTRCCSGRCPASTSPSGLGYSTVTPQR